MKENLPAPARNVLQGACYDDAHNKHEGNAVTERIENVKHRQCSAAIDVTVGTGEKSAVDKCMRGDAAVDTFAEPAEKAVQEEI